MNVQLQSTNERMRPWLTPDDKAAVMAVLDRGDLMSGREVAAFEEELAAYFGKRHAVCVSSGTAALECAFVATGEGDKIQNAGYVAILSAARAAGRNPREDELGVGTDVLGDHHNVCAKVHDCSHGLVARGSLSCFSFNQNKFIACGGGVVVTNDSASAALMRQYRNHGRDSGPEIFRTGRNLRMGEMNAALGRSQLKRMDEIIGRRAFVAHYYRQVVGENCCGTGLFLFAHKVDTPRTGRRLLTDFRLWRHYSGIDDKIELLPIWPLMTREDCEAACLQ